MKAGWKGWGLVTEQTNFVFVAHSLFQLFTNHSTGFNYFSPYHSECFSVLAHFTFLNIALLFSCCIYMANFFAVTR